MACLDNIQEKFKKPGINEEPAWPSLTRMIIIIPGARPDQLFPEVRN
jgi:hypothetical protein